MSANDTGPTLTDPVGMGGVIAQDGFDYQIWEGLIRLPGWLKNPAFEAVIFEGLEDIESRFFAPHAPAQRMLERLQAKSGTLASRDIKEVFERFLDFENQYPQVTRVHTLVTQQLPSTLQWISRDAARVRRARPFYFPFAPVRGASDAKLTADFVAEYGPRLGQFVADAVEVEQSPLPARRFALNAFITALGDAFPSVEIDPRRAGAAFGSLEQLVHRSRGVPLTQQELLHLVETELNATLVPRRAFPLHIRSDRNGTNESALEVDASAFSGSSAGFPEPSRWQTELVMPLDATARWVKQRGVSRILLSGSYRLTTAFLLGRAFRAVHGFDLDIVTREGPTWATDDRAKEEDERWDIAVPRAHDRDDLLVSVGVLRRPSDDLASAGFHQGSLLTAFTDRPIASAKAMQAGVTRLKAALSELAARLRPRRIRLYYAGPAAFAVALGHRWNALPRTELYEFDSVSGSYVATASVD